MHPSQQFSPAACFYRPGNCAQGSKCQFLHTHETPAAKPAAAAKGNTFAENVAAAAPKQRSASSVYAVDPNKPKPCFAFRKGKCTLGADCKFVHEASSQMPVRARKLNDPEFKKEADAAAAEKGAARLRVKAEREAATAAAAAGSSPYPGQVTKPGAKVCFAFRKGACTQGEKCQFVHSTAAEETASTTASILGARAAPSPAGQAVTAPGKVLNKAVAKTVAHNQALGKKAASKADDTNKIFVGNLALTVDSRTLRAKFDEKFGGVAKAQVIWDQAANASRGFGFVTFTDTALYEKALLETIGFEIGGRPVNITQCDQGNKTVCYAFKRGKCAHGDNCKFSHEEAEKASKAPSSDKKCKNFMKGCCKYGENCYFSHDVPLGVKVSGYKPCRVFQTTGVCPFGDKCQFSHDADGGEAAAAAAAAARAAELANLPAPSSTPVPDGGLHGKPCYAFIKGKCTQGEACQFSHNEEFIAAYREASRVAKEGGAPASAAPAAVARAAAPAPAVAVDGGVHGKPCFAFIKGKCTQGGHCQFSHDEAFLASFRNASRAGGSAAAAPAAAPAAPVPAPAPAPAAAADPALEAWFEESLGFGGKKLKTALQICEDELIETVAEIRSEHNKGKLEALFPQAGLRTVIEDALGSAGTKRAAEESAGGKTKKAKK